jgi:hypothetical protein
MRFHIATLVVLCLTADHAPARLHRAWLQEELLAESDLVALIEPIANQPSKDIFTIEVNDGEKIHFEGVDTRFRIDLIFKSDGKAAKELTLLHFSEEHAVPVVNGPSFVYFIIGPLEYEKRVLKDGKELGKMTAHKGEPTFLAFLKRRADGRYEPVTGQEDADESFFEIHIPFFPIIP